MNISELDVRLCDGGDLLTQQQRYHDLVAACVEHESCTDVSVWGVNDMQSLFNDHPGCTPQSALPLLFDESYEKKPAYAGVIDALLGR